MIPALLTLLSPLVGKILDRIPNPTERIRAEQEFKAKLQEQETELLKLFTANDQGQIEVNKVEAAHQNLFVAGWRPFIGWTCGAGVAWAYVIRPLAEFFLAIYAPTVVLPVVATEALMTLLMSMLGLGAMRSYEKFKGVARER